MDDFLFDSGLPSRMEPVLTRLAKACLIEQPDDVEKFCCELLAKRIGVSLVGELESSQTIVAESLATSSKGRRAGAKNAPRTTVDEDLDDLDEEFAGAQLINSLSCRGIKTKQASFNTSDGDAENDDDAKSSLSNQTSLSQFARVDTGCDEGPGEYLKNSKVRSMAWSSEVDLAAENTLFSSSMLPDKQLEKLAEQYETDERMSKLFEAWDGDGSGAVDLVELVVALHKFEEVATAGTDIQIASDALVQCDDSDDRQLQLPEFAKVIVMFCHHTFKKDFDEMAEHLLAVATSSSEAAVRQAATGIDVSELEAADKEEEAFLRETVKGMEEDVSNSIRCIKMRKIRFA